MFARCCIFLQDNANITFTCKSVRVTIWKEANLLGMSLNENIKNINDASKL